MASAELDLDQLSDSERTALETYTTLTGQEQSEAIPLLRRSQWNVQVGEVVPVLSDRLLMHLHETDRHLEVL